MPLQDNLTLYAVDSTSFNRVPYIGAVDSLTFRTTAPGGCADLTATIKVPDVRLPRSELDIFSRVALVGQGAVWWQGEIMDQESGLSDQGAYYAISALGYGNAFHDDQRTTSYNAQTASQIAVAELAARSSGGAWPWIDPSTALIFPDNPGTTYSPAYPNKTMEEVVANVCTLAGDYMWGVWPSGGGLLSQQSAHLDPAGFPLGQLQVQLRDTTTTHYMASEMSREVSKWRIIRSGQRAYGIIRAGYNDPNASPPVSVATYTDPRIAAGTAPFRPRSYSVDFSGNTTVSAAQAQAIANTYGVLFQNPTNKIEITLKACRDGLGNPIPLHQVQAGKNILVPTLTPRGSKLAFTPIPGVNQFYILEVAWTQSDNDVYVTLTCDNFVDTVAIQVARLQLASDTLMRTGAASAGAVQAQGAQVKGWIYGSEIATAGAQAFTLAGSSFAPAVLSRAPTSIAFSNAFQTNATGPLANNLGQYGFNSWMTSITGGACSTGATFLTSGNCIYDVDEALGTFTHHCDGYIPDYPGAQSGRACNLTRRGLSLKKDILVDTSKGTDPHQVAFAVRCPVCHTTECYNGNLGPEDERDAQSAHTAQQARFIRAMMRHPSVGLHGSIRDCACAACLDKHGQASDAASVPVPPTTDDSLGAPLPETTPQSEAAPSPDAPSPSAETPSTETSSP